MLAKNEMAKVYDTLLCIPGMNEEIKINFRISRRHLLLLHRALEKGLGIKEGNDKWMAIIETLPPEDIKALQSVTNDMLERAQLATMNEKLNQL
jgi:hypothetical protein